MLNSNLQTTLSSRAALQKKYDTLTTDTNAVSGNLGQAGKDLEKAKTDLEKAKKDLATAQSDQAKAQESITDHQADIAKALKYLMLPSECSSLMIPALKWSIDWNSSRMPH